MGLALRRRATASVCLVRARGSHAGERTAKKPVQPHEELAACACSAFHNPATLQVPRGTKRDEAESRLSFDSLPFQFRLDDAPFNDGEREVAKESYGLASQREASHANDGADAGEWEDVGMFSFGQGLGQGQRRAGEGGGVGRGHHDEQRV